MLTLSPARNATTYDCLTNGGCHGHSEFLEFDDHMDLLDFDDLFGIAGDVLPDSEIHPEVFASSTTDSQGDMGITGKGEEVVSKRKDSSFGSSKNNQGKRKVKVDWTAELHRRFVEAVEQLGVEKAVPSRILELMGVNCLTRHNVASHLQKYRSHRKHSLAREAKRHIYGSLHTGAGGNQNGWLAPPTIGFPRPPVHNHHFRPLHVWGHPTTVDHSVWPKHLPPPSTAMPTPPFSPYWHRLHNGTAPYLPAVSTALPPNHTVYKADHGFGGARPPVDLHPSKESVDAAIGDVLRRPWLPLPLGLKPPAVDGVMTELHNHGVSEVPPTTSCA